MENTAMVFKRNFSQIGEIQNKKQICYGVIDEPKEGELRYGIGVLLIENGTRDKDFINGLSDSKDEILEIVTYLYENAVKLEDWREVTFQLLLSSMAKC